MVDKHEMQVSPRRRYFYTKQLAPASNRWRWKWWNFFLQNSHIFKHFTRHLYIAKKHHQFFFSLSSCFLIISILMKNLLEENIFYLLPGKLIWRKLKVKLGSHIHHIRQIWQTWGPGFNLGYHYQLLLFVVRGHLNYLGFWVTLKHTEGRGPNSWAYMNQCCQMSFS